MGSYNRYEAVVKLENNAMVKYHNINTGLFKFHRFVQTKFKDSWIIYTVRRIESKEIIGTFKNNKTLQLRGIRIHRPKQRNDGNTGFFVRFPFIREGNVINRNLFFADKIILSYDEDYIIIREDIYQKAIKDGISDLEKYFEEMGQFVARDEIQMMEIRAEKVLMEKKLVGNKPEIDFP